MKARLFRHDVCETAALEHRHEARIDAEGVPLGIDGKEYQVDVVGVEGTSEPIEGEIGIAEAGMDEGDGVGRDETLAGRVFEGLEDLQGFGSAAAFSEDVAAERQGLAVAGTEPTSFVERVEGKIVVAQFDGNLREM